MSDASDLPSAASRRAGAVGIALGFAQGLALWLLTEAMQHKAWPATQPGMFGALAMVAMFAPFVVLGGISALRPRTLAVWTLFATAVLAGLGLHDLVRRADLAKDLWISVELICFGGAGLFIAHHLVAGGDAEQRVIARYPRYFDIAWKHGVQLALSAGFVGVFWILLSLGAALFNLIGIGFVAETIRKSWFYLPATATMFAAAVHLTDMRASLIRGVRTVALTLLSWLLPVLVLLAAAFLIALPFTGLEPLWKTRSAASILLSAAAALIILINAAYQDGEPDGIVPPVLRFGGRLAGLLLLPMIGLAAYAVWLRIGQYGLTPDRVIAAACVLVGGIYAIGYAWAAVRLGRWMRRVEWTNIGAAFVVLGVLLAIFSPLADPARLSVDDQMARLKSGKATADTFDYEALRFDGERYGQAALRRLKAAGGEAGERATKALALNSQNRWARTARPEGLGSAIDVLPKGRVLPETFLKQDWSSLAGDRPTCAEGAARCVAVFLDLDGDGREEILVAQYGRAFVYTPTANDGWKAVGFYNEAGCRSGLEAALREGRAIPTLPVWKDLNVGGRRFSLQSPSGSPTDCPGAVVVDLPPSR